MLLEFPPPNRSPSVGNLMLLRDVVASPIEGFHLEDDSSSFSIGRFFSHV